MAHLTQEERDIIDANPLRDSLSSILLASRTGREALVSNLTAIRLRVQKGNLKYKQFRPLSQLVIKQAPDINIWAAIVALIRSISHLTPPPSLPPSFKTPITYLSASQ
ncbi:hypothetical protein X797_012091 [Metarhizium robertsii]|uniref:Uncharacterized protein n=2 Tax=Metarhizium robertsii TaxID=568076 RepID=E9FD62_METRA|nr:uncharacterized protein MAA_10211 [Metarhizium robertsii ARSEF 23]EFY94336.1 hypothetical protein MAA_10211 [Metarhizium robertsii ARSEF 23]EXU94830.1 hypothetical protein X797_012091 [Metarhizium robertsii]